MDNHDTENRWMDFLIAHTWFRRSGMLAGMAVGSAGMIYMLNAFCVSLGLDVLGDSLGRLSPHDSAWQVAIGLLGMALGFMTMVMFDPANANARWPWHR